MTDVALLRTPLYDRHVAAGARLVPFAGWEMPVQYAGIREEHRAVRDGAPGSSTSRTWARSRRRARARGAAAAAALQRRRQARRRRRAVQRAVPRGRRRARRPLHLPARRRPLPDGHERRQPRQGPRVVPASTPRTSTARSTDRLADWAMLAVQGPRARGIVAGDRRRRRCRARFHRATLRVAGARGARLRHRLHRRGRRRDPLPRPSDAGAIWDAAACAAAPCRPGSARATRCAWRSATTSTATT